MRILFVCHGNICRSPMAECVMADLAAKAGLSDVSVASAGTSDEEYGNDINPRSREQLDRAGIPVRPHFAHRMTAREAREADLIVAMDGANVRNLRRMVGPDGQGKVHLLLDFAGERRDVADPWYTGDYATAFADIRMGCEALVRRVATN